MLTPELDENTEKLSTRARALINAEFITLLKNNAAQKFNNETLLRISSPPHQSASKSSRTNAVKTARKKIQDEWEALKNATIISNESPDSTSQVLNGVVAYIEINNVPKSIALKVILENLGATVKEEFTPEVTHLVFKKGTFDTFKRAKLLNVHLVSVLWIEACKSSRKRIDEALFPIADYKDYASPRMFRRLMEMGEQERNKFIKARNDNERQRTNKESCHKRVTRSSAKSQDDSSETLVLQISTDDSGKKNIDKTKPQRKKRLFASVGDEMIDQSEKNTNKNSQMKRKLFTNRPEDSTLTENSEANSISDIVKMNPYEIPGRKRIARKKKQTEQPKTKDSDESDSTHCSEDDTIDNIDEIRELIKLTQTQSQTVKKIKKKRLIREKKKKKLTKEDKENIKKANKMARRQENEAIKASQPRSCKKINIYSKTIENPSLVSTFLHKEENKWLKQCIEALGGFTFKAAVDGDTTHVVAGKSVRTINLLKGLARGCWLVDKRWVHDSMAAGHWLVEHDYELTQFSNAVQKCRFERQVLGEDYRMDIFRDRGAIYIGAQCVAKRKDVRALVSLCCGRLVTEAECADIVIGDKVGGKTCVSDQWVLDSITAGRCRNLKSYTIL